MLCNIAEELEGNIFPSSYDSSFYSSRERETKSDDKAGSNNNNDNKVIEDKGIVAPIYSILNKAIFLFIVTSIKVYVGGNIYTNSLLSFYIILGVQ